VLYERLSERNPSPYAFLIEHHGRSLVGASPEFLVRLEGERATLRPLAGTRPRGDSVQHDEAMATELLTDVKERAEHVMLVDLGRNDLSRVCRVGSVTVDQALAIERYSHVMHIASSVSGRIADDRDAFDLFFATFPAGTVTGAPKRRAMELIAKLEPTARDVYAGSVAHFRCDGSMDAALTLRSIAVANGQAVWQAAAGIVHRSQPELEYAEVLAKTRIARTVLGVAEPSVA
jgi:anthranilate synthase component 1